MIEYCDCNATTPCEPAVLEAMAPYFSESYGNAGSRTHSYGALAKQAVEKARDQIGRMVGLDRESVVLTSGATESNNIAILGLATHGRSTGKKHIICSAIEHKAVLEPMEHMARQGFELTVLPCEASGQVSPSELQGALRDDTMLVSIMQVNNETGIRQDIQGYCEVLSGHDALLHVDAAQGYGKFVEELKDPRIDLISASAHKVYGPKGIGALFLRRRGFHAPPIEPLQFGGGQERGLRPGTLPVPLVVGFGVAAEIALREYATRHEINQTFKHKLLECLIPLGAQTNGDQALCSPHCLNISIPGVDSEAAMVALKQFVAISNGSACTSSNYSASHVLVAMGLDEERIDGALRWSWCHLTQELDWSGIRKALRTLIS